MSGHRSSNTNSLSDYTTGALVGVAGDNGVEYAVPGFTADSSGTPGAATQHTTKGRCAIAIGASSVVITNRNVRATSTVLAVMTGAAADATLTSILRVTPANGSLTITGNANATAATQVDYVVFGAMNS